MRVASVIRQILVSIVAGSAICIGASVGGSKPQSETHSALHQMGMAEGEAYLNQRSVLLASHPTPWDVGKATTHSWEAGLAAFILNARLNDPDAFAAWDVAQPLRTRGGSLRYGERHPWRSEESRVAFFVEKGWKTAESEDVARLCRGIAQAGGSPAPAALWQAIWEQSQDHDLRLVALHAMAQQDSPYARKVAQEVLEADDKSQAAKLAVLEALREGRPAYRSRLVLACMPRLVEDDPRVATNAIAILREHGEPSAAPILKWLATDVSLHDEVRCSALAAFTDEPLPDNIPIFAALINSDQPSAVRICAMRWAVHAYSTEAVRDELRRAASDAVDVDAAVEAIRLLADHGTDQDRTLVEGLAEDPKVSSDVRKAAADALLRQQWKDERKAGARQPR